MAVSLKDIFNDINSLCEDNKVEVNGKMVELELFLGGDMKVIFSYFKIDIICKVSLPLIEWSHFTYTPTVLRYSA